MEEFKGLVKETIFEDEELEEPKPQKKSEPAKEPPLENSPIKNQKSNQKTQTSLKAAKKVDTSIRYQFFNNIDGAKLKQENIQLKKQIQVLQASIKKLQIENGKLKRGIESSEQEISVQKKTLGILKTAEFVNV